MEEWTIIGAKLNFYNYWTLKSNYVSEITLDIWGSNYFDGKMNNGCILGPSSIFIFIFFPVAALWNSLKCNVIQQIKKLWPNLKRQKFSDKQIMSITGKVSSRSVFIPLEHTSHDVATSRINFI